MFNSSHRRSVLRVLALLLSPMLAHGALEDNLTAYWPLDGSLDDVAGTISMANTVDDDLVFAGSGSTYGAGKFGTGGYSGNGNGHAEVNDSADLDETGERLTVSAWINVTAFDTGWQAAISKGENDNYRIHRSGTSNNMAFYGGNGLDITGAVNVNDGGWHHVVGVSDAGNGIKFYINGAEVATRSNNVNLTDGANKLMIGNNPDQLGRQWNGQIDDVAIWRRALSAAEVAQIYNAGTSLGDIIDPPALDGDSDGLTDDEETTYGTNPSLPDTDMDGVNDGVEVVYGTSPTLNTETPPSGSVLQGVTSPGTVGAYLDGNVPSLTPSAPNGENWVTEDAFPNLTFGDLKGVVSEPNSTYIHVIERAGTVQRVNAATPNTSTKTQVLNISSLTVNGDNGGLRSVVFHPNFNVSGAEGEDYLYCFYSTTANTSRGFTSNDGAFFYRLSRFTRNGSGIFGSELVLIQQRSRDLGQHFGGGLAFDQDGFLMISWGDMEFNAGRVGVDFYQDAQRIDRIFQAAVLRIDVDNTGGSVSQAPTRTLQGSSGSWGVAGTSQSCGASHNYYHVDNFSGRDYMIPSDNYFLLNPPGAGSSFTNTPVHGAALDEHVALGVRNPWRMAVDPVDGDIAMFNVGSNSNDDSRNFEEVEIYKPGANYGWPYREGTTSQTYETGRSKPAAQYGPIYLGTETDAAAFWVHNGGGGQVAVGGVFYRGTQWPSISQELIFADHQTGRIWALDYKTAGAQSATYSTAVDSVRVPDNYSVRELVDTSLAIRQMAAGPSGDEVYIAANGDIYRLYNSVAANPEAPALLSSTGAFTNLATLTPRAGLIPYTPASKLWSDRAYKQRWIAVPNDAGTPGEYDTAAEKITYSADGEWEYPNGTVFIKQFSLPTDLRDPDNATLLKPIETRFLVKGSDGVHFYFTYEWRSDGSDADLLTSGTTTDYNIIDEAGDPLVQTWTYPSRANCIECHQTGAGSVLGMKSRQMNNFLSYPSGDLANQITTFSELDLFDVAPALSSLPGATKCVDIADETQSLELRVHSYLDSNCSFCHRPESDAGRAVFDVLLTTPISLSGLINGTPMAGTLGVSGAEIVKPGSPSQSVLYLRDAATDGDMMPPIGRSIHDPTYIPVLYSWIQRIAYTEFDSWATTQGVLGGPEEDSDGDDVANVIEFFLGMTGLNGDLSSMPRVVDPGVTDPEITIPISGAALTDGFTILVEGSTDMETWYPLGNIQSGLTQVSNTASAGVSGELRITIDDTSVRRFIRYGVVFP